MLSPDARPRPRDGYVLEALGDELVIFHPATTAIFYCNATAALIFRLCDGERDVAQIVALLSEQYPDAGARMLDDVTTALERLVAHGALELA